MEGSSEEEARSHFLFLLCLVVEELWFSFFLMVFVVALSSPFPTPTRGGAVMQVTVQFTCKQIYSLLCIALLLSLCSHQALRWVLPVPSKSEEPHWAAQYSLLLILLVDEYLHGTVPRFLLCAFDSPYTHCMVSRRAWYAHPLRPWGRSCSSYPQSKGRSSGVVSPADHPQPRRRKFGRMNSGMAVRVCISSLAGLNFCSVYASLLRSSMSHSV